MSLNPPHLGSRSVLSALADMQTWQFKALFYILTMGQILKLTILLKNLFIYLFLLFSFPPIPLFFHSGNTNSRINSCFLHPLLWSITHDCSIPTSGCLLSAGRVAPSVQSCCETQLRQELGSASDQEGIVGMYLRQCAWFRKKGSCLHRECF